MTPRQRVHLGTNLSFRPLLLEASELHLAFNETEVQVDIFFIKRKLDIASIINSAWTRLFGLPDLVLVVLAQPKYNTQ